MTALKTVALVFVLVICFVGYRVFQTPPDQSDVMTVAEPEAVPLPQPMTQPSPEVTSTVVAESELIDKPGCLTRKAFEEHPLILQDAYRLSSVSAAGTDIDAYAGIDEVSLRAYTDQGDSAAMTIVGAIAVVRAFGLDESRAIAWLNGDETIEALMLNLQQPTPAASLLLNDAAYWFYQAALHGRLFALQHYGTVRSKLFGGVIGLGWLTQEEYDALDDTQRAALSAGNVYRQATYDIAPQLEQGSFGDMSEMTPDNDIQRRIRTKLVQDFEAARTDSELPPLSLPAAASSEIEELKAQICASEFE